MEQWTTADIPDLTGKTAIITGANSGVGYETAFELARHGATTIIRLPFILTGRIRLRRIKKAICPQMSN